MSRVAMRENGSMKKMAKKKRTNERNKKIKNKLN